MLIDLTTPVGALGFEGDRALPGRTRAEFERTATLNRRPESFLRIEGRQRDAAATFRRNPYVQDFTPVVEDGDRAVYRLHWGDDRPQLLRSIDEASGTILSSVVRGDTLSFEVRFPDHDAGSRFYAEYDDRANPISIRRSRQNGHFHDESAGGLTPKQRETLCHAAVNGYFEIPRRISLDSLGDDLGVTDNAVSERIRRGTATLVHDVICDS